MGKARILVVVGTRPEVIKMAPVVRELRARPETLSLELGAVSQHGEILTGAIDEWGLDPDWIQELDKTPGRPADTIAAMLPLIGRRIESSAPDLVLVHGDTNTTAAAALAAAYSGSDVGHVEAGLRTGDPGDPFPEETNRRLVDGLAHVHYAPTALARQNLLDEGADPQRVFLVGNTVIDALIAAPPPAAEPGAVDGRRMLLVTGHRRESFESGIDNVCRAIRRLVTRRDDMRVVYVLHPHPRAHEPAVRSLSDFPSVELLPPQPYGSFLELMRRADLILTDSGGIQEEAPLLGKPVLVTRVRTERTEGLREGVARLVGLDPSIVVREVSRLLDDREAYAAMARRCHPYGEPGAAARIADSLVERFQRQRVS